MSPISSSLLSLFFPPYFSPRLHPFSYIEETLPIGCEVGPQRCDDVANFDVHLTRQVLRAGGIILRQLQESICSEQVE